MHVWVIEVLLTLRIVGDVLALSEEVVVVADAVLVIARVPYVAGGLLLDGVGVTALDELDDACGALVDGWGDQDVDVIWHGDESMQGESACVAVMEEYGEEEFRVGRSLEMAMLLKR